MLCLTVLNGFHMWLPVTDSCFKTMVELRQPCAAPCSPWRCCINYNLQIYALHCLIDLKRQHEYSEYSKYNTCPSVGPSNHNSYRVLYRITCINTNHQSTYILHIYMSAPLLTRSPHATFLYFRQTGSCIQIMLCTSIMMMLLLARVTADN